MVQEDADVSAKIQRILSDEGIQVLVSGEVLHDDRSLHGIVLAAGLTMGVWLVLFSAANARTDPRSKNRHRVPLSSDPAVPLLIG
jgi:hypothetical protein